MRRAWLKLTYMHGPRLMSALRKRWVKIRNPDAVISFGRGTHLAPGFSIHAPFGGTFRVGEDVQFRRGFRAELAGPDATIEIGSGGVVSYYVLMQCSTTISIGDRVMFGQSTMVVDGNHRFRDLDTPMLDQGFDYRPIRIEDDVTITTKCTIIADIGERAFIGANTVVAKPVPAFTLAAGNPARELEYFGP